MVGQPRQHIGEPGLRIDAVELGGLDQGVDGGGAAGALVGARAADRAARRRQESSRRCHWARARRERMAGAVHAHERSRATRFEARDPKPMLDALDLAPDAAVGLSIKSARLVVDPKKRRRYSLDDLLAQCKPAVKLARGSRADGGPAGWP
jgi:antitoxin component of MazEF toxin-antitoxin module